MKIYGNVLFIIILFVLIIESVNGVFPMRYEWCLDVCKTVYGIKGPYSDWNKYLHCILGC